MVSSGRMVKLLVVASVLVALATPDAIASPCGAGVDMPVSNVQGLGILGALYDYRSSQVIPGNFWPEETLKKKHNTYQVWNSLTTVQLTRMETEDAAFSAVDVAAEVVIPVFGNLISVGAGIAFLLKGGGSDKQQQYGVTAKVRTVTESIGESLVRGTDQSGSRHFNTKATHVVTSVSYGGDLSVIFREKSGSYNDAVGLGFKLIGKISIAIASIRFDLSFGYKRSTDTSFLETSVDVYSDVLLDSGKTSALDWDTSLLAVASFTDQISAAKSGLFGPIQKPLRITEGEDEEDALDEEEQGVGIPIKVHLSPICGWFPFAKESLAKPLAEGVSRKVGSVLYAFRGVVNRVKRLSQEARNSGVVAIQKVCLRFLEASKTYLSDISSKLAYFLPRIKAGVTSDMKILELMDGVLRSPFAVGPVNVWLDEIEAYIELNSAIFDSLKAQIGEKAIAAQSMSDLASKLRSPVVDWVAVFIHVPRQPSARERFLAVIESFVAVSNGANQTETEFTGSNDAPTELYSSRVHQGMKLMKQIDEDCVVVGNCDTDRQAFFHIDYWSFKDELTALGVSELTAPTIALFKNGKLVNEQYEPCASPSDPRDGNNGKCLYSGNGDIPAGAYCGTDLRNSENLVATTNTSIIDFSGISSKTSVPNALHQSCKSGLCGDDLRCSDSQDGCRRDPVDNWFVFMLRPTNSMVPPQCVHLQRDGSVDAVRTFSCVRPLRKNDQFAMEHGANALLSARWGFSPELPGHIFSYGKPNLCLQAVPARYTPNAEELQLVDRQPSQAPTLSPTISPTTASPSMSPQTVQDPNTPAPPATAAPTEKGVPPKPKPGVLAVGDRVVVRPCLSEALYQRWILQQDQNQDQFRLAEQIDGEDMCLTAIPVETGPSGDEVLGSGLDFESNISNLQIRKCKSTVLFEREDSEDNDVSTSAPTGQFDVDETDTVQAFVQARPIRMGPENFCLSMFYLSNVQNPVDDPNASASDFQPAARAEPTGNAPLCGQRLRTLWYRNGPHFVSAEYSPLAGTMELTMALDEPNDLLVMQNMLETDPDVVKYRAMLDWQTTTLRLRTSTVGKDDQCLHMNPILNEAAFLALSKAKCAPENISQQFLRCGEKCNDDTCSSFEETLVDALGVSTRFNRAFCVENGLGPLCQCKPGYSKEIQADGTETCEAINACINHPCQDTHFCVRAQRVVTDTVDGRECLPRSGCEPGFKATPFEDTPEIRAADTVCLPCDEGEFQAVDDFHGDECLPHSEPCSRNRGEVTVVEASAVADWVCTKCSEASVIKCDPSVGKCGCVSEARARREQEPGVVLQKVQKDGSLKPLSFPTSDEGQQSYAGFDAKPVTEMGFRLQATETAEQITYDSFLPMDMLAFNIFVMVMFFTVFALTLIVFGWYTFKVKVPAPARKTNSGV